MRQLRWCGMKLGMEPFDIMDDAVKAAVEAAR